jgi:lantibiotic modifying enzyme
VAPVNGGAPVQRSRHVQDVVDGYMQTAAALAGAHAHAVLAAALREAAGIPLRYVHRPTAAYLQLRRDSLAPDRLAVAGGREAFLRNALGDGAIARAERSALLRLDVPLFCCTLEGRGVRELGGSAEVAWLDSDRGARVLARATRAADPDLIVSAFASGPVLAAPRLSHDAVQTKARDELVPAARDSTQRVVSWWHLAGASRRRDVYRAPREQRVRGDFGLPHRTKIPERDELVRAAVAIGDLVLGAAIEAAGPALAWLGLRVVPESGLRVLERLPPDVLSGTSGIAVALARLYAVVGEPRFAVGARRALQPSLRELELHVARRDERSARPSEPGVLHGPGAWLYASAQCAMHLEEPDLYPARASRVLAAGAGKLSAAATDPLEAYVVAFERTGDPLLQSEAARLAARFIARRGARGSWFGPEAGADRHNLSAVTGVCALADRFLRLAEPGRFGSIREGR